MESVGRLISKSSIGVSSGTDEDFAGKPMIQLTLLGDQGRQKGPELVVKQGMTVPAIRLKRNGRIGLQNESSSAHEFEPGGCRRFSAPRAWRIRSALARKGGDLQIARRTFRRRTGAITTTSRLRMSAISSTNYTAGAGWQHGSTNQLIHNLEKKKGDGGLHYKPGAITQCSRDFSATIA